ncbi:MAG: RNA polymerase sigma factor [Cellulosilyticaceae bacterium]
MEKKLIKLAQKGNSSAFEKLIIKYEKNIYNICLRMLNDEHGAYDAAQEVCMKIWRQLHIFEGNSKFSTWIYRIATNQCLDILRKYKNKNEISIYQTNKNSDDEWLLDIKDEKADIDKHMEQLALQDVMQIALSELKDEYKQVIVLRELQNQSYDEIGDILNISQGTVKSRLSRARSALKKILSQNKEPYLSFFRQNSMKEDTL